MGEGTTPSGTVVPLHADDGHGRPAVTIRRATLADVPALLACLSHPRVQPQLLQVPYASEERWRKIVQDNDAPGSTALLLVAELPAHESTPARVIGNAGLRPVAPALRRRHAMGLGIAVLPEFHGRGVGEALMTALTDYADRWGQVLRLELSVFTDNARAIRLYERHGFRHEGRHVGYALRDGAYADVLSMARLHPNPPRWQSPAAPTDES